MSTDVLLVQQVHEFDSAIFEHFSQSVASMMDNRPFSSIDEVWNQTEIFSSQWNLGIDLVFCVIDAHTQDFLGQLAIMRWDSETPEIGIWIAEKHQRKGAANAAIRLFMVEFPCDGKEFLYPVSKLNAPSIALARKLSSSDPTDMGEEFMFRINPLNSPRKEPSPQ